jgi:glutamate dehydrogenase
LGLVKAQQVKNAVIVPVGAKGGFVPKHLPAGGSREAVQAEGTAAYKLFVSSLIEITDNLDAEGRVVPPVNVVRHDDDDPYLVVAADKGTATFSDTANGLSKDAGFWLDDAFASGGSAGYDHKKMGITARGAFEAVKRHFRERDIDIAKQTFTVAGIGDMSGDVFGNGMLLARTIRLVAAFDHRDIFLDPNPDPEASFAERKRLFDLPRSSWQDYAKNRLSIGGGVYPRSAKFIDLSPQARALLKLGKDTATPQEVMQAILKLDVDLMWFGGIGTYVKAQGETDDQVGDRANDAIRVTASDLNCRIIGEGANLGMTQRGRIAASLRGIRLNTDAIDNSGGVNSSDVEVNVKIALAIPERQDRINRESRNEFLARMTDEVADIVLRNNYLQTLALSLAERRGLEDVGFLQRLMQMLEQRGQLNRAIEYLPDDREIEERRRAGRAMTRPELAVLLAYAKLTLFDALVGSNVPDDPYLSRELVRYFPKQLQARFPDAIQAHRLRREIVSTQLSNSMINRGGPSLIPRIADQTGATPPEIAAAFAVVRDSYKMTDLNTRLDALDGIVPGAVQLELYAAVQDLLLDRMVWFLRGNKLDKGLAPVITRYQAGIDNLRLGLNAALPLEARNARDTHVKDLMGKGVPEDLAAEIASLPALAAAPDITNVADATGRPFADIAATYFAASAYFRLDRLIEQARGVAVSDYFDRLAVDRALDQIAESQRRLAGEMAATGTGAGALEAWVKPRAATVERIRAAIHEIAGSGLTISKLTVAASLLGDLVSA